VQPQSALPTDSALRLAVDIRRLPWMRRLAVDYAFDFPRLAQYFAGDPAQPAAWAAAIGAARQLDRPRAAFAALLVAQQERRSAPRQAIDAARQLADPDTVAIVTGQQAGLFGGPLFTVLKAVTAVRLAARVAREHHVRVVPVFWIDAEDHDWEEVRTCGVLDAGLELVSIEASPPDGAGERMVGALAWRDDILDTIEALRLALPETEFSGWVRELVSASYRPGFRIADSFGRLLEALLGEHGLVVFDASDGAAKPLVAGVFARELEHAGATALAAARAGAELVSRGYHMQVTPHPDSAALFAIDRGRRAIRRAGDAFVLGDETVPAPALIDRARRQPETFSPNVLLRPIVQDTLFPTICYVAGPNELAYLAQLKGVYDAFGVPMPLMQSRATATLLDSAGARFLTRYPVALEQLQAQNEHALNELLKTLLPPTVERAIAQAEAGIAEHMEAVIAALPSVDPTLEGKARSVLGRMQHELATLHNKVLQAAKRRDETLRRQFMHARAQAFPGGHPQERVVSGLSFLNRYGPGLVTRLLDDLPLDAGMHSVVTI
jgi:bacillithiol biosynthesis cysteine-adding enzyme BshC